MKKYAVTLILLLVVSSFALSAVAYNDWNDTGSSCTEENSTACPDAPGSATQYVRNGSLSAWSQSGPNHWMLTDADGFDAGGWAGHWAKVDLTNDPNPHRAGVQQNFALGAFLRNTGGSSSQFMYVTQDLAEIQEASYAWNKTHISAWTNDANPIPYNSVAFYTISSESDPTKIADEAWRELYPDQTVCMNATQVCNYLMRAETVYVEPGMKYHIKVGNKFGQFNSWTSWVIDDISLVPIVSEDPDPKSGWIDEGNVDWDKNAPR